MRSPLGCILAATATLTALACGASSSDAPSSPASPATTAAPSHTSASTPPPAPALDGGAGAYPSDDDSVPTRGGTMTFTGVGAEGWWPRRLDRPNGDPACDYKDGTDTWGGVCCMTEHHTESTSLAPFDEEMTLILKAIDVKQLAVYQPQASGSWALSSSWDRLHPEARNFALTRDQTIARSFDGTLQHDDCVSYLAQDRPARCGDYFCPNDPGVMQLGWAGSKLFVVLANTDFADADVASCQGGGKANPGPWMALVSSELIRDGGRKWNGACNCYSKTGSVGDGCGEINLFEVVMDDGPYANRDFASTGVRSFQAGHVGGNVCGEGCDANTFADDVDLVDACSRTALDRGAELEVGTTNAECPVWRRPRGDRYFLFLLDETSRTIQIAMMHPARIPAAAAPLLPALPAEVTRDTIDALLALRLPEAAP